MSRPKDGVSLGLLLVLFIANTGSSTPTQQVVHAETGQQQPLSAHATSISFAQWAGLCSCYCGVEVQVNPQGATLFKNAFRECQQRDPQRYRDFRVHADLSNKHWKELEKLADKATLLSLPDSTGCASCVDSVDESIEVVFSDKTKKSVQFPMGMPPKELLPLHEKLSRMLNKLEDELVNYH